MIYCEAAAAGAEELSFPALRWPSLFRFLGDLGDSNPSLSHPAPVISLSTIIACTALVMNIVMAAWVGRVGGLEQTLHYGMLSWNSYTDVPSP